MNSGMYSALSGNLAAMKRLDVITSNLANVGTSGFKQDRIVFDSLLAGDRNPPAVPENQTADPVLLGDRMITDFSAGSLRQTGNVLDVAIQGDGFFAVTTPDGTAYTRQGNFRLAGDGTLITASGYPVQSQTGQPIVINIAAQELGGKPVVDSQGNITLNNEAVASLGIFDFPKPYQLTKTAGTLFVAGNQNMAPQPVGPMTTVVQGALEESNVDAVSSMVQMIEASRYFESCQKVIRSYDDMASKAVNELARV
ncbi:flagellar basal-body rod protein FlgF [Trichlorobacter ammonificans]|uniref:Flagellar basal-body rod protein FlgF n=1 Tax=Trichlorobacter ammonificans TaxID=2916410 RepID=A0ABM9D474_9BACT|nr:flagellar basal-body rod protein FlgF [Trichlorobacter ammonificans]CAH2030008.1 Flagellar basal-body rod protein FlgF [Trichlorobacter ammonificans]